ncbi:MAG: molecular chaperone HscC [Oscillospiraceae bacterium]|nr:molecular chaperone HscC [Oscillospiraceae bacterium]
MAIIGIDLGTTNSLAAVWRNGKSELIPNASGEYLTPSCVSIDEGGTILVGRAARDRLITHPDRTAAHFKRKMGTKKIYRLAEREFTPEELSSFVLRSLRADAEAFLGEEVSEAVISVPAYFSESQRAATKRAAMLAGLKAERLINEPSAAAVAGHIGEGDEDKVCLVFDLGGGTLDVSLVERFENVVSVSAVSGDNHLGGQDFDLVLAKGFCEDCGINYDALSRRQQEMLARQAETCKMALSTQEPVVMAVDDGEIKASLSLSNEWLIRKSSTLFQRMTVPIRRVLLDAGISLDEIDDLVMVGGSSHMPAVRRYIARTLDMEPARGSQPDTAVGLGAGICAGMKARAADLRELVMTDVCPFTLGVGVHNHSEPGRDLMSPIIERNNVLPSSKEENYCTVSDKQTSIHFGIYQGENRYCEDNTLLGELKMTVPAAPKGVEFVKVRFTYDINGLLEVNVTNRQGQTSNLVIQNGDMSQEETERRLKELSALKLHPREQEEHRALLARGERLYAVTVGELRDQVAMMLDRYQAQLSSQEPLRIARAARRISAFFDRVEAYVGDVDPFFLDDDPFESEDDEL